MTDDHSRACRLFLERNGEHAIGLARGFARTFDLHDEADDILQDAVEILLARWGRSTPTLRPADGVCDGCDRPATRWVSLSRRGRSSCDECLVEAVDDLRRGYLSGILRRTAHRAWERRRRRGGTTLDDDVGAGAREAVGHGADVEHEAVRRWVGLELGAALHALPARQRDVLLVRFVEGRSVAGTAEHLGLSVPAVKMAQHRGAAKLRSLLPPDVVELFAAPPTPDPKPAVPKPAVPKHPAPKHPAPEHTVPKPADPARDASPERSTP